MPTYNIQVAKNLNYSNTLKMNLNLQLQELCLGPSSRVCHDIYVFPIINKWDLAKTHLFAVRRNPLQLCAINCLFKLGENIRPERAQVLIILLLYIFPRHYPPVMSNKLFYLLHQILETQNQEGRNQHLFFMDLKLLRSFLVKSSLIVFNVKYTTHVVGKQEKSNHCNLRTKFVTSV